MLRWIVQRDIWASQQQQQQGYRADGGDGWADEVLGGWGVGAPGLLDCLQVRDHAFLVCVHTTVVCAPVVKGNQFSKGFKKTVLKLFQSN